MYHQSQATKVHVVYCFFIARPVLLHVEMGHTNQTSHLFLKPELRYRNAILLSMGNWKPTEGQGLRIAICHNMQENFQRQLRHITNTYFTASIVSHSEPEYWDQMTKKTSLKKKDVLQPPRASLYIVAIRDHNELEDTCRSCFALRVNMWLLFPPLFGSPLVRRAEFGKSS